MASTKAGGSTKNVRDSNPKYLGVKRGNNQAIKTGMIIVRQRGTKVMSGPGTRLGKDHTIFAVKSGVVKFTNKRKTKFDGTIVVRKLASVI